MTGYCEKIGKYLLKNEGMSLLEIKKSKFRGNARRIGSLEDGKAYLAEIRDDKATHHCWGCRIHGQEYCSDDGEPSGTAGNPILSAIRSQGIEDVMVIVRRYYGGIKLGTGGLIRAYGATAHECLRQGQSIEYIHEVDISISLPITSSENVIYEAIRIQGKGSRIIEARQLTSGWNFLLKVPSENAKGLIERIRYDMNDDCVIKIDEMREIDSY